MRYLVIDTGWVDGLFYLYTISFSANDDMTYILATDADVKFTPTDVMTLMDLMSRNPKV